MTVRGDFFCVLWSAASSAWLRLQVVLKHATAANAVKNERFCTISRSFIRLSVVLQQASCLTVLVANWTVIFIGCMRPDLLEPVLSSFQLLQQGNSLHLFRVKVLDRLPRLTAW